MTANKKMKKTTFKVQPTGSLQSNYSIAEIVLKKKFVYTSLVQNFFIHNFTIQNKHCRITAQ